MKSMKQLYVDKDKTGDVNFIIGSERVGAHRCLLAAISSKYKAQFYGLQPDNGDIEVNGSSASAFRKFIEFFYLEEVSLTIENIEGVLDLAKQSLVDEFFKQCVDFLMEVAPLDNLCLAYRLAILYDIEELKELCESLIKEGAKELFKSEDFINNCDRDLLLHILKLDSLRCDETEVFDACISWAKAACKQKNVDAEKAENLRIELDEAITQIRFGSMKIEDFVVRARSHKGLFSPDETNEICYLIGQLKDFKSEKFNQKPRNFSERHYLECNRVLSYGPADSFEEYVMGSWIGFSCNHSIRLEGFTVGCCNYKGLCVCVLNVNNRKQFPKYSLKVNKEKKETTITFDEPIDVNRDEIVQIIFDIDKCHMSTRYKLACKITSDRLMFDFQFNAEDFFVTKLLYNKR